MFKIDISKDGQLTGDEELISYIQMMTFTDEEARFSGFSYCG